MPGWDKLCRKARLFNWFNISNRDFSEDIYFDVIRKKTAALFTASAESGALSAGASEEEVSRAADFGEMIGIAFQIKDDIFDYYESPELGKPTGNDMLEANLLCRHFMSSIS